MIREELAAWLNSLPNMFAVTLRYNGGPVSIEKISRDIRDLQAKVDRKFLGREFNRSPNRSSYWAVPETLNGNPHVHCGWAFPSRKHGLVLAQMLSNGIWQKRYSPGGTHDIQIYDRDGYVLSNGWAGYALKACHRCDDVILSAASNGQFETPLDK